MKTTVKQFEEFKNEILRLQPILGLNRWKIYFEHKKIDEGVFARTHYKRAGAVTNIQFNLHTNDNRIDIKQTAKHECLHLLLADLFSIAENREFDYNDLEKSEEQVIRILEKLEF